MRSNETVFIDAVVMMMMMMMLMLMLMLMLIIPTVHHTRYFVPYEGREGTEGRSHRQERGPVHHLPVRYDTTQDRRNRITYDIPVLRTKLQYSVPVPLLRTPP
jgi:hypothetical protein